jgi:hypothetical protein
MTGTVATFFSAFFSPSPPRAGEQRNGRPRQLSGRQGIADHARQESVRALRTARASQHRRISALQAESRCVDRHVRPRLVDHRHHAERDPLLGDVKAVLERPALHHLSDRVLEIRDLPNTLRHLGDPRLGQREPVDQRFVQTGLPSRVDIRPIRLEQPIDTRIDPLGQVAQKSILGLTAGTREQVRGILGLATGLSDGFGCSSHRDRVTAPPPQDGRCTCRFGGEWRRFRSERHLGRVAPDFRR